MSYPKEEAPAATSDGDYLEISTAPIIAPGVDWVNTDLERAIWASGARGTDLFLMLTLNTFANRHTFECYPSFTAISRRSGLNPKTIHTHIHNLAENGWIRLLNAGDRRGQQSYRIRFTLPELAPKSGAIPATNAPEIGADRTRNRGQFAPEIGSLTNKKRTKGFEIPEAPSYVRKFKPGNHKCKPDESGYCTLCEERVPDWPGWKREDSAA